MLFALASCNKNEEQQKPQQYNLQLDLTAQVDEGATARAMDYKLSSGKVKYTLEGKSKVSVLTCIYEGTICYTAKSMIGTSVMMGRASNMMQISTSQL